MKLKMERPLKDELWASIQQMLAPRVTEVIFLVAGGLWLTYRVLATSFLALPLSGIGIFNEMTIGSYVFVMVLVCELGTIIHKGYTARDAYALAILVLMGLGVWQRLVTPILYGLLLVFCARSYDVRKTLRVCSVVLTVAFLVVVVSSGLGLATDMVFGSEFSRVRHCLGFLYPLFPAQIVFCLTCVVCYLRGTELSIGEGIALLAVNVLTYATTVSRLSFVLGCLLVLAVMALDTPVAERATQIVSKRFKGFEPQRMWELLTWSYVGAFVFSVVVTLLFGFIRSFYIHWFDVVDKVFGGRLMLGYNGLFTFGFKAFGQFVGWQGNGLNVYGYNPHSVKYNYVDNMFLHVLLEEGWVYLLGLIVLCTLVARKAWKEGDRALILVIAAMALHCIVDDLAMFLHYDLLYFLIAGLYVGAGEKVGAAGNAQENEPPASGLPVTQTIAEQGSVR